MRPARHAPWFAALVLAACVLSARAAGRPNFLFILADDLGWRDPACCGHPAHRTPHLDRLAREGMRFTQAYAPAPICSASRAAILTGRTPARLGFEFVTKAAPGRQALGQPLRTPPFTLDLPLEEITLAEALGPSGYATGLFGKWHVSRHHGGYLGWSPTHGPLQQGFDAGDADFGGHPYGYGGHAGAATNALAAGQFPADALTEKAIAWMRGAKRPFFLCLSHYYVHDPVHTRGRWLAEECARRLPPDAGPQRAAYGAMVETLDDLVGRALRALDEAGLAKDTVVVFTSDNGGHPAYTGNGPLRGGKWNLYEGGLRVPLIVRWPGVTRPGTVCDEPVTGCDVFPTFRDIAGVRPDTVVRDGRSLVPWLRDPAARGEPRRLVWHFPYYHPEKEFERSPPSIGTDDFAVPQTRPHSAIREDDFKLLHFYEDGRDELYNLHDDPGERRDLVRIDPDRARDLRGRLDDYLREVRARLPEPDSTPPPGKESKP